jgi:hypothetical protein
MEIDELASQFEDHEKQDEKRFNELGSLVRSEISRVVVAISGNENADGLRGLVYAVKNSVPENARERLRTLEQLVPSDLPVVLSALRAAEERRVIAMRLLWGSVASLTVTVAAMIVSKLISHQGPTP